MKKCKTCNNTVDVAKLSQYASGNFCSKHCARSFSTMNDRKSEMKVAVCIKCGANVEVNKRTTLSVVKCDNCKLAHLTCRYGCGKPAKHFITTKNYPCCSDDYRKCSAIIARISTGVRKAYMDGRYADRAIDYNQTSKTHKHNFNKWLLECDFDSLGYDRKRSRLILEQSGRCLCCGLSEWNGRALTLELEHIDGDRTNNIRANLKMLCPNCHSQTKTWRRRKICGNGRRFPDNVMIEAIRNSTNMNECLAHLNLRWGSSITINAVMAKYNITFNTN